MTGTAGLLRLALRRDRVWLTTWVLVLLGVTYGSGKAMGSAFPTQSSLDAYARSVGASPAVVAMAGPPLALDTLAGVVVNKVSLTSIVGVVLVASLTVCRHTRAEEESGRTELLLATAVGRRAPSLAALVVALGAVVLVGAGSALALVGADVPAGSAWLFGLSLAGLGAVFASLTLVLAQVLSHPRGVLGASLAVFGVAYVVRAAGDVGENGLVWLSPVGWMQATHPLGVDERWWPLAVPVVVAALLVALSWSLEARRDVGAGLLATRRGPASGSRRLAGPVALALRQQRAALFGWGGGLFLLAAASGSLTKQVGELARDNPTVSASLADAGNGSPADSFLATMLLVQALLAAAFATTSALRLRSEETSGRLEVLLATGLSRTRWLLGSLVVTAGGTVLLLLLQGAGLGLSYALVRSDPAQLTRLTGLALVYAPAALAMGALAVLLVGWLPRAVPVAWAALSLCFVLGWFGGLLHPPYWLESLSPFFQTPAVPVEKATLAPAAIAVVVVLLVVLGASGARRRDLG